MRVLLTDKEDGTLFVMDVTSVAHDPAHRTLICAVSSDDLAIVSNISHPIAKSAMQVLFSTGKADLSEYRASHLVRAPAI